MMSAPSYCSAIFMSAYGASPYLAEQVDSITAQMGPQDILVIVDDGSRNVDWVGLKKLPANYLFWTRINKMGVGKSFFNLIMEVEVQARYYFLSDQDDVWMKNKLMVQKECHQKCATKIHATVHAWIVLNQHVNKQLHGNVIQPIPQLSPAHYFFETPSPGMTLSFTNESRQLLVEHKSLLINFVDKLPHDRILCAFFARHGQLQLVAEALVHYRQHTDNLVGAPSTRRLESWGKRIKQSIRTWRTASHGLAFYMSVNGFMQERCGQAEQVKCVGNMELRSNPADNRIMQCTVRLLNIINRFHML